MRINYINRYIACLAVMIWFCFPEGVKAEHVVETFVPEIQQSGMRTITGLVTEANGDPVIGGTVGIKGTTRGVTTDLDGRYSIQAADGEELEYRYIGFNPEVREVKAGVNTINVRLITATIDVEDVVVIGYGQQKKESVVASMNSIGPAELTIANRSLTNSIAGKISGVIAVTRSGEPGWDDATFWIRGVSSFAGGTDPLVLVDGVPRSMNNIDVDEIESFTVLKDAAATAVYGAEGANGVILVTSKRGKAQKTIVSLSVEHGINTPMRVPKLLDSYSYLSLYNEAVWNDQGNPLVGFQAPTSDEVLELYRTGADPDLYPNANWMDMLKKNTHNSRYTINFRGGGERVRFFVSGSYYGEDGIYKDNPGQFSTNVNVERYNLRSNVDFDLTTTTRMSVDMSGQYFVKQAPVKTADDLFNGMTLFPVHIIPKIYSDGQPSEHPNSDNSGLRQNPYNFLYLSGYDRSWSATVQSKVMLEQDLNFITEGLSVRGAVSFDAYSEQFTDRTMSPNSVYATGRDENGNLITVTRNTGSALGNPVTGSSGGNKKIYIEASFNYKRTFNNIHDVTGLLLYNQKETQTQNASGMGLLPYRKQSVVARASYGYDDRYMVEASFGMTGSENFAQGNRWGIFPAVGAAWFVSHEGFMENTLDVVNKLKLRVSYGKTGNDDVGSSIGRYPYMASLTENGSGYNLGYSSAENGTATNWMGNGIHENRAAAPQLKWEIEDKFNTGIDLGLWRGRIDMSVDYFYNRRHDILLTRNTIPSMTGLRNGPAQNYGIVTNQGIDGNIVWKENFGKVGMIIRGNFTYTKNKIVELDEIPQMYSFQNQTGYKIGQPLLYIAEGLYTPDDFTIGIDPASGTQTYTLKDHLPDPGSAVAPGDIKYKDLNNDGVIDNYDRTRENGHNPTTPNMVYGFSLNLDYKGFYGGVFFQGVSGSSINLLERTANIMPFYNGRDASSARVEALDRWQVSNPAKMDVLYPRMHSASFAHNEHASTWWYRNSGFIRLKNVEFGYQFDKQLIKKLLMQNLRIYVQGTNLVTWDHVKYWDPELAPGRSGAKYPLSRTWTMGLEVTF